MTLTVATSKEQGEPLVEVAGTKALTGGDTQVSSNTRIGQAGIEASPVDGGEIDPECRRPGHKANQQIVVLQQRIPITQE